MDENLNSQVRLIKSQINILNVTPLRCEQYGDGSTDGQWKFQGYYANVIAVYYEFPYRVKGERYWSKQVFIATISPENSMDDVYSQICDKVALLRSEVEE